jgi:hypothetical protein
MYRQVNELDKFLFDTPTQRSVRQADKLKAIIGCITLGAILIGVLIIIPGKW